SAWHPRNAVLPDRRHSSAIPGRRHRWRRTAPAVRRPPPAAKPLLFLAGSWNGLPANSCAIAIFLDRPTASHLSPPGLSPRPPAFPQSCPPPFDDVLILLARR